MSHRVNSRYLKRSAKLPERNHLRYHSLSSNIGKSSRQSRFVEFEFVSNGWKRRRTADEIGQSRLTQSAGPDPGARSRSIPCETANNCPDLLTALARPGWSALIP